MRNSKARGEQADGRSGGNYHRFLKKRHRRIARHRARMDPECLPAYNRYRGYET